jgi:hypothetical protein
MNCHTNKAPILLYLCLVFIFASCEDDESMVDYLTSGQWNLIESESTYYNLVSNEIVYSNRERYGSCYRISALTFQRGGRVLIQDGTCDNESIFTYEWEVKDGRIVIGEDSPDNIGRLQILNAKIISASRNELILENTYVEPVRPSPPLQRDRSKVVVVKKYYH